MGTKRQIAPAVANVISSASSGPLLDLFSGMCAVGSAVGVERPVWCNDVQHFAFNVASAFFTGNDGPPPAMEAAKLIRPYYGANKEKLTKRFGQLMREEERCLEGMDASIISKFYKDVPHVGGSLKLEKERRRLAANPRQEPYRLVTITFAGGYVGLNQAVQTDSLRFAADRLLFDGKISVNQHRWMLLALCEAVCKVATTTGHFAQFITVKPTNLSKFVAQRRRSVYREWLQALDFNIPLGSLRWRRQNNAFRSDAQNLLEELAKKGFAPSVIYADPPYTSDQYSRYYHLYETLILYDYPKSDAVGRYRPDRFQSAFSIKTEVAAAFGRLLRSCAKLGSEFVLSYPDNGLLPDVGGSLQSMLKRHFRKSEIAEVIQHRHSSLGASSGPAKQPATEIIFWAH